MLGVVISGRTKHFSVKFLRNGNCLLINLHKLLFVTKIVQIPYYSCLVILFGFLSGKSRQTDICLLRTGEGKYQFAKKDIYDINLVFKLVLPFKSLDIWSQTNIKIVGRIGLEFPDLEFM